MLSSNNIIYQTFPQWFQFFDYLDIFPIYLAARITLPVENREGRADKQVFALK